MIHFHSLVPIVLRVSLVASLAPFLSPALEAAGDWPRWRGPDGNNVSTETGWSATGAGDPVWQASIGRGYSSPVIAEGRVYVTGFFEEEEKSLEGVDKVHCLDALTGEVVWGHEYPALAFANEHKGGALSTPTVFEGVLYLPTRKGEVRAFDAATGEIKWEVDLVERHQVEPGRYGFASSPFVLGDGIVLNAGHTVMLERATGETLWISDNHKANYSTVAPIQVQERECLVVFGEEGIVLVDAGTGEHVSTFVFRKTPRNVEGATPIVMGSRVFISSGYDQGGVLLDYSNEEPELVWRTRRMRNKMAGCTLFDGHLYGFDESMLKCIDLGGEEQWRVRGLGHGALSIADGHLLLTTSTGELVVAKASPEGFEELSRRSVVDEGVFWTAPILVNGRVYFRGSEGALACLDHRGVVTADAAGGAAGTGPAGSALDLPSPAQLEAAHMAAAGLTDAPVTALTFTGRLHNDALGLADRPTTWSIDANHRWHWKFDLPPGYGASISLFFDGTRGWQVNPLRGDALLEEDQLKELRTTGGLGLYLDPLPDGLEARTVAVETFGGALCRRVDVQLTEEDTRSVFFDAKTGLVAGRTAEQEDTVHLTAWREAEGRLVPMHRTTFDADSGEESRLRFTQVSFSPLDDELFVIPEALEEEEDEGEEIEEEEEGDGEGDKEGGEEPPAPQRQS